MRRDLAVLLFVLVLSPSLVKAQELGLMMGTYRGKGESAEYHLTFRFGIEQWEDNKPSTFRYQQWFLRALFPEPLEEKRVTWCDLERVVIDRWQKESGGTVISSHWHSTTDGNLKFKNVNLAKGIFDFNIVLNDLSTIEIHGSVFGE